MNTYIIKGNCHKAVAVRSHMNHMEMEEYVRAHSKKVHKDSYDTVFTFGLSTDLVNPKVMSPNDFASHGPYIV